MPPFRDHVQIRSQSPADLHMFAESRSRTHMLAAAALMACRMRK